MYNFEVAVMEHVEEEAQRGGDDRLPNQLKTACTVADVAASWRYQSAPSTREGKHDELE